MNVHVGYLPTAGELRHDAKIEEVKAARTAFLVLALKEDAAELVECHKIRDFLEVKYSVELTQVEEDVWNPEDGEYTT
jgi:hypothetical protein